MTVRLFYYSNYLVNYRKKNLATQDCFLVYLINAESLESRAVCSETGFISEHMEWLFMKTFVVVDSEARYTVRVSFKNYTFKLALC